MADIKSLSDLKCSVRAVLGETRWTLGDIQKAGEGTVFTLDTLAGEPVVLEVNGKPLFKGEVVVVDENFGIRVVEVLE